MTKEVTNLKVYFIIPIIIIGVISFAYLLQFLFYPNAFHLGLNPGKISGLWGILFMPFLHGDIAHLLGNISSLFVLLIALRYFYPKVFGVILLISWFGTGILTWFIADSGYHIGASGIVYALAFFLFFSGIININKYLLSLSLLVGFLYGGLIWGVLPIEEGISWEGHLSGALMGFLMALLFMGQKLPKRFDEPNPFENEDPEEVDPIIGDQWKGESTTEESPRITYTLVKKENKNE